MADAYVASCCKCLDCPGEDQTVTTVTNYAGPQNAIRPPIAVGSNNYVYWGCFPEGLYTANFCGGCLKEDDDTPGADPGFGWYVTRDDPRAIQTWPGNTSPGFFYDLVFMEIADPPTLAFRAWPDSPGVGNSGTGGHLLPASQGWPSDETAFAHSNTLGQITIYHRGGPIGIHATWPAYGVGFLTTGTDPLPTFSLVNASGDGFIGITANHTCGRLSSSSGLVRYEVDFHFVSLCPHTAIAFTLSGIAPTNQLVNPTSVTQDITIGDNVVTLQFDLRNEANKCFTARMFMDGGEIHELTGFALDFDLTPVFVISDAVVTYNPFVCSGFPQAIDLVTTLVSGLTTSTVAGGNGLKATISGSDVSGYTNGSFFGCAAPPLSTTDGPSCESSGNTTLCLNTVSTTPSSVTFTVSWSVGSCALAPDSVTVPLVWS